MAPSRAMRMIPITKIFEEAAIAACQKTQQPARRLYSSSLLSRSSQFSNRITPSRTQRTISTATEPISTPLSDSTSLPDPLGAPRLTHRDNSDSLDSLSQTKQKKDKYPTILGRVATVGLLPTIIQVTVSTQRFDPHFKKHFPTKEKYLVYEPQGLAREGDVVRFKRFEDESYRIRVEKGKGKQIKHEFVAVESPFGEPIEQRTSGGSVAEAKGI